MQANKRVGTKPERLLRSELHRRGLQFRKDFRLDADGRKVRPDIVFPRLGLAVFVDGCFWHRCPQHGRWPKRNSAYWDAKFGRNVARDQADDQALARAGWAVIRVWEHEPVSKVAAEIVEKIRAASDRSNSRLKLR